MERSSDRIVAGLPTATAARAVPALDVHGHGPEDRVAATADAFTAAAGTLAEPDFADPRTIATVAPEVASTNEALRQATSPAAPHRPCHQQGRNGHRFQVLSRGRPGIVLDR